MGSGFAKKKKEARHLQEQFQKMQSELEHTEFTGSAGNGLVAITLNGDGHLKSIKIKPDCVDPEDVEGLEALIKAAHHEAEKKVKEHSSGSMPKLPGGFSFPGL